MLYPAEDPRRHTRQEALAGETVELGEAARGLGLSAQGLWAVIEQRGLRVLRLPGPGRSHSSITRVDFEHLLGELRPTAPGHTLMPPDRADPSEPLVERVRRAEQHSSKLEAGVLEMRTRLAQSGMRVSEAQQRMAALRERFKAELEAAQTHLQSRGRKLEVATERERDLSRQLGEERERHQDQLLELHGELEGMRRELDVAEEVERANAARLDRMEREARARRSA